MLYVLDAWSRYAQIEFWWIHAMTAIWILFTLVLFVLEPLFLHEWFRRRFDRDPEGTLASLARLHWLLLSVSLVTVLGAIAGAHGMPFFN
jgi:heme/copper-type cytochrome/quinol oxidase subunit 2